MQINIRRYKNKLWYVTNNIIDIRNFTNADYCKISKYCVDNDIIIDICTDEKVLKHKELTRYYGEHNSKIF